MRKLKTTGPGSVYVVAEAGVNHNGSLKLALQLVDIAADAGANAVKFQTFTATQLVTDSAPKARYQVVTTGLKESQMNMLKKLELSVSAHRALIMRCQKRGIDFLSSPFDIESLRLLTQSFRLPVIKIPSGEITNAPLLLETARSGRRVILSTGMCTLAEVETALGILAFGYAKRGGKPTRENFSAAYFSAVGQRLLREKIVVLHCVTDYPTRSEDVNLRAMGTLRSAFGLPVGFSDHSQGIAIPIAAAALGACIIEKHFTLDRGLPGPDHRASLEPDELKAMVNGIRQVEKALGNGIKLPTEAELSNRNICRKFLVAACEIDKGEIYSVHNLTAKRVEGRRSPLDYWELLGQRASRRLRENDPIE